MGRYDRVRRRVMELFDVEEEFTCHDVANAVNENQGHLRISPQTASMVLRGMRMVGEVEKIGMYEHCILYRLPRWRRAPIFTKKEVEA